MNYEYVLILFEEGGIMQTRKKYEKEKIVLKGDVQTLLKKAKTVLSDGQYRKLCAAVNVTADYNEKKGLIIACIKAKKNNF